MNSRYQLVLYAMVGILVGAIGSYIGVTRMSLQSETPTPVAQPEVADRTAAGADIAREPCTSRTPAHQLGFVDGELVIAGSLEEIDAAVSPIQDVIRERRTLFDFSRINVPEDALSQYAEFSGFSNRDDWRYSTASEFRELRIEKITLDCSLNSIDAREAISSTNRKVSVEFNRLTARSAVAAQYTDVVNDPTDSIAPIDPAVACCAVTDSKNAVATQAASLDSRLAAPPATLRFNSTMAPEGSRVKVAILDNYPVESGQTEEFTRVIGWAQPNSLTLGIVPFEPNNIGGSSYDRSDHGVFTAGLIHSLDSTAAITIYQVLDNEGEGTLSKLIDGLERVLMTETGIVLDPSAPPTPIPNAMDDVVIHLGLHFKDNRYDSNHEAPTAPSFSTKELLLLADAMGATTVVSSGNYTNQGGSGSPGVADPSKLAMEPGFSFLTSVGAAARPTSTSTPFNALKDACFARPIPTTNGVREFGGFAIDTATNHCDSLNAHKNCRTDLLALIASDPNNTHDFTCDDALISLTISQPPMPGGSPPGSGYGYWIGTSFSSAQIAGWIAKQKELP